jgi:hypothetical protein
VLAAHDVTLTTYGVLASEFAASKANQQHEEVGGDGSAVAGASAVAGPGPKASGGARDGATWGHQPVRARRRGAFSSSCRPPWIASSRAPTLAGFNQIRSVPIVNRLSKRKT